MDRTKTYLQRYPHARTQTILRLQNEDRMFVRLRAETEMAKAQAEVNRFRDSIGYVGWFRLLKKWMGK